MPALTPIESEFDSTEEAAAHDAWVREKVRLSLADPRPAVPHARAMLEIDAIIAAHEKAAQV